MMKIYKLAIAMLSLVFILSCNNNNTPTPPISKKNRTVLLYIAGDTSGNDVLTLERERIEAVWNESYDGSVLVFHTPLGQEATSKLYRVESGKSTILKDYGHKNACDPAVLSNAIADAMFYAPAESYGLVLSSHGTGWLPKGGIKSASLSTIEPFSFGDSRTHQDEMDIDELAAALPKNILFDYIIFNACYMESIEIAYQLRNNTKYLIGSASELWMEGVPYEKILGDMMSKVANVTGIASKTFDYYNNGIGSITMSTIDCSKLSKLAAVVKEIVDGQAPTLRINEIQKFAVLSYYSHNLYFDLGDFISKTWSTSPYLAEFNTLLDNAVQYTGSSSTLNFNPSSSPKVEINSNSGMTAFIPIAQYPSLVSEFRARFDWSRDSGLDGILFDF